MLWNIPLHCVKICHCDWFNKELNGQQLVRKSYVGLLDTEGDLWEEERWGCQVDEKEGEHVEGEVKSHEQHVD